MKAQKRRLNGASLATQDQHVLGLDDEVLSASRADEADEYEACRESSRDLRECEDHGRRLTCLEADGNPMVRALACLARVGRALEKVEDGTYGFSDVTGRQIPHERLATLTTAICTLDDEEAFERADEPGRLQ